MGNGGGTKRREMERAGRRRDGTGTRPPQRLEEEILVECMRDSKGIWADGTNRRQDYGMHEGCIDGCHGSGVCRRSVQCLIGQRVIIPGKFASHLARAAFDVFVNSSGKVNWKSQKRFRMVT
jgi:hypothetical protein